MFALYETEDRSYSTEDGGGRTQQTRVIGVDESAQALHNRWNAHVDKLQAAEKARRRHADWGKSIPPKFPEGGSRVKYSLHCGGGLLGLDKELRIRPFTEFDSPAKASA